MSKKQLLNHHLSSLRVTLVASKLSVCNSNWKRFNFSPTYNKFYYICDGEGWIKIGNDHFRPKPGELMFIPAGTMQSFSATEGTPYTMYWCHFNSNIAFMQLLRWFGISHIVAVEDAAELLHCFRQLIEHRGNDGPASSLKIQSALLAIVAFFIERAIMEKRSDLPSVSIRKLLDTVNFIDANLYKEISVEELARIAHFHPNYLIRVFKRHLGMPPKRYIHERRLEKAEHLLASTDMTVNEVAHRTGFNDVSYFSASFKRKSGVSPSEFRNVYAQNNAGP
ncbi:AraC family transcriptional regulator [Paenibacillus hamazuiensis]|uniref:AraC family transcriptional regulator n=1 Tax=Paenibacillus hamazuiensis TaxID=2936508 RepID=UPI00200F1C00|nr:AraC family transcriptional regulator [Paenibacillus hamazuiensis]